MMTPVTMVSREPTQQSDDYITGKVSKKTYGNIAPIATLVNCTGLLQLNLKQALQAGMRPMDFIAMDLIGEFHPPSSQGNRYALTGICMLTGFTWCIPLKSKKAAEVSRAYLQHVYSVLGGSTKILTDNGTEFKNEVFKEMLQKLGTEN